MVKSSILHRKKPESGSEVFFPKIPFIIVCGKKEVADNTVTVRKLGSDKQETIKREKLIKNMIDLNKLPLN